MQTHPSLEQAPDAVLAAEQPVDGEPARRRLGYILAANVPFVLAILLGRDTTGYGTEVLGPLGPLLVGAIIFLIPGLAWSDWDLDDAAVLLFRTVLASLAASFVAWLLVLALPGPTSRVGFLLLLLAITNVGLWRGLRNHWYVARPFKAPLTRTLMLLSALFYAQCYLGAAHFVPALEDQDMELQGTAYGLIHALVPTMSTNQESRYYFAHPLLLHLLIGESALLSGDLDRLRYYHEGSVALGDPPAGGEAWERWVERSQQSWSADYERFLKDPVLVATRTPNMFFSALLLFPLGLLAYRLSGLRSAAILACLLYATLPEIYVRGCYGGYMAIANFMTLAGCYFYVLGSGLAPEHGVALPSTASSRRLGFTAAFLGGWADQKVILLPLAAAAQAVVRVFTRRTEPDFPRAVLKAPEVLTASRLGLGFFAGWATYALYGLAVAPRPFFERHILGHVIERIRMDDVNLKDVAQGDWVYPSIVALWQQFSEHTGWLLIALALPALVHAAKRVRAGEGIFLWWIAIAALGFSVIDWRQTKHLAQFLPALALLIAVFWASLTPPRRGIVGALLAVAIGWNVVRIGMLMQDFEYLKPLPIW